jgi:methylphosphotriester-DNA--protein-cysteine methyltransferase
MDLNEMSVASRSVVNLRFADARVSGLALVESVSAWIEHPDTQSVEQICKALSISHPRLLRLCRKEYGVAPKALLRRARFVGMLQELRVRPYGEWKDFLDPRYVDQSHFIRDFQHFLKMAPRQFLALPGPIQSALSERLYLTSDTKCAA